MQLLASMLGVHTRMLGVFARRMGAHTCMLGGHACIVAGCACQLGVPAYMAGVDPRLVGGYMWPVVECHGEGLLQVVHASYRIKRVHIHMRIKVLVVYHNSTQSDKMELNVTPPESPDYMENKPLLELDFCSQLPS